MVRVRAHEGSEEQRLLRRRRGVRRRRRRAPIAPADVTAPAALELEAHLFPTLSVDPRGRSLRGEVDEGVLHEAGDPRWDLRVGRVEDTAPAVVEFFDVPVAHCVGELRLARVVQLKGHRVRFALELVLHKVLERERGGADLVLGEDELHPARSLASVNLARDDAVHVLVVVRQVQNLAPDDVRGCVDILDRRGALETVWQRDELQQRLAAPQPRRIDPRDRQPVLAGRLPLVLGERALVGVRTVRIGASATTQCKHARARSAVACATGEGYGQQHLLVRVARSPGSGTARRNSHVL